MTILFILLTLVTIGILTLGAYVSIDSGDATIMFPAVCTAIVFWWISAFIPISKTVETPISNPSVMITENSAIVGYNGQAFVFNQYSDVTGLKNGEIVPMWSRDYNFYGWDINSQIVLKRIDGIEKVDPKFKSPQQKIDDLTLQMQEAWQLVNAMAGQEYWDRAEEWLKKNERFKPLGSQRL